MKFLKPAALVVLSIFNQTAALADWDNILNGGQLTASLAFPRYKDGLRGKTVDVDCGAKTSFGVAGFSITEVDADSPLKGTVVPGDVICGVDGYRFDSTMELLVILRSNVPTTRSLLVIQAEDRKQVERHFTVSKAGVNAATVIAQGVNPTAPWKAVEESQQRVARKKEADRAEYARFVSSASNQLSPSDARCIGQSVDTVQVTEQVCIDYNSRGCVSGEKVTYRNSRNIENSCSRGISITIACTGDRTTIRGNSSVNVGDSGNCPILRGDAK